MNDYETIVDYHGKYEKDVQYLLDYLEEEERRGHQDDTTPEYPMFFSRPVSTNPGIIFVDEYDTCQGYLEYSVSDNTATIYNLVVSEKYQRQHIATELYEYLKSKLKKDTWVNEIKLSVRANNEAVIFYEKLGFVAHTLEMFKRI